MYYMINGLKSFWSFIWFDDKTLVCFYNAYLGSIHIPTYVCTAPDREEIDWLLINSLV